MVRVNNVRVNLLERARAEHNRLKGEIPPAFRDWPIRELTKRPLHGSWVGRRADIGRARRKHGRNTNHGTRWRAEKAPQKHRTRGARQETPTNQEHQRPQRRPKGMPKGEERAPKQEQRRPPEGPTEQQGQRGRPEH